MRPAPLRPKGSGSHLDEGIRCDSPRLRSPLASLCHVPHHREHRPHTQIDLQNQYLLLLQLLTNPNPTNHQRDGGQIGGAVAEREEIIRCA